LEINQGYFCDGLKTHTHIYIFIYLLLFLNSTTQRDVLYKNRYDTRLKRDWN